MQRHPVPLLLQQKVIVGTGLENQIVLDSGMVIKSEHSGIVDSVTTNKIIIIKDSGHQYKFDLQTYQQLNQRNLYQS